MRTHVLSGFMELLPAEQLLFNRMKDTIRSVYERFGFVPLDTPVMELAEVLLAKAGGETEKQIYQFTKGDNELALRFDLTVPLARYVSEHFGQLTFPYRRYHIGKVYRGERPQKGRFREFYQCDIDIIGDGELSLIHDAEIPAVIYTTFTELGFERFTIRINNRQVLGGLFESLGFADRSADIMRAVDKLDKIGWENVREELQTLGLAESAMDTIRSFLDIQGSPLRMCRALRALGIENERFRAGVDALEEVVRGLTALGVPEKNYRLDVAIARGLDYYTGTVYETILDDHPGVGSVCSGGRYDNLAEFYTNRRLPGVGISIGLTRLFYQLTEAGVFRPGAATPTRILVLPMTDDRTAALAAASQLRAAGIPTEVYLEGAKFKKKMKYANSIGVPFVLILGEEEIRTERYSLKNMATGEQESLALAEIIDRFQAGASVRA
ncbi:MAG: histidine--tRNA ligase [Acidobacteria bacterium]|nr:histidine--tRNA ligase [Acidobacteriota bacterium]